MSSYWSEVGTVVSGVKIIRELMGEKKKEKIGPQGRKEQMTLSVYGKSPLFNNKSLVYWQT